MKSHIIALSLMKGTVSQTKLQAKIEFHTYVMIS
jgi:hypothetical protein